jgi:hypothetical protein
MNTFDAYKLYLALRLHFTSDNYDIRKTKGRVKASEETLKKNLKLQLKLMKLNKQYKKDELIDFFVANFISSDKWGGVYDPQCDEIYLAWKKIQESLSYRYKQDLLHFRDNLNINNISDLWDSKNGHPIILKEYFGQRCTLETLIILNKLFKFTDIVDEQLVFDPVWNTISKLIYKYSPFIKIEKEKYNTMTAQVFSA